MAKVTDPVCKMIVDTETAAAQAEYRGQTYYFCAPGCKKAFERDPAAFVESTDGGSDQHAHGH